MSNVLRVTIEAGPKGRKFAAVAPDWPGLQRGAKTEEAALERLLTYTARYQPVADLAGFGEAFASSGEPEVNERFVGVGSTDFWGIAFGFSEFDRAPIAEDELERDLTILQACWTFFDQVALRVSAELRPGPRGGGRDRDHVIRHTIYGEQEWWKKVGIPNPGVSLVNPPDRDAGRAAYLEAIRAYRAAGKMARTWPLRFLVRMSAYHMLDHAWEMEDRDLSGNRV